jgi:hypothetical protein
VGGGCLADGIVDVGRRRLCLFRLKPKADQSEGYGYKKVLLHKLCMSNIDATWMISLYGAGSATEFKPGLISSGVLVVYSI